MSFENSVRKSIKIMILQADFVVKFESAFTASQTLDNEQEDLKAKLKTKTAALDAKVSELEKFISEARKVVKLEMEKETWKSFGIADTK